MVAPALLRGDELMRLCLRALYAERNVHTSPLPQDQLVICVEFDKTNSYGEKLVLRGLTRGAVLHNCPLLHFGLLFASRTCFGNGQPLSMSSVIRGDWYVICYSSYIVMLGGAHHPLCPL